MIFLHFSQLWVWCKGFGELMTDFQCGFSDHWEFFHRTRPREMTTQDYNVQVDRVNKFLKKFYEPNTRVQFWTIRGLVKPSWNIWIDDGTHLNNSVTKKYAKQIRMAVRYKNNWLNDWLEFYAVTAIFQSCNGDVKLKVILKYLMYQVNNCTNYFVCILVCF